MMHTFFKTSNDKQKAAPNNPIHQQVQNNQTQYRAKIPTQKSFTLKRDAETGLWYRPGLSGFGMNRHELNEDNLRFIKVLKNHRQLEPNSPELTRKIISDIVRDLDYDSDLWDDIFDNQDIFRPLKATEITPEIEKAIAEGQVKEEHVARTDEEAIEIRYMTEQFINQFVPTIEFKKQKGKPKTIMKSSEDNCYDFIKDRIHVFKFYIYLRRCAILFRDTKYKHPLTALLKFLGKPAERDKNGKKKLSNYGWLKTQIRVKAFMRVEENWNSGLHEWLTCKKTIEALRRTAGLEKKWVYDNTGRPIEVLVQPYLSECMWVCQNNEGKTWEYPCSEFNWLDLQLLLRTPDKYAIFISENNTIEVGHCSSVYSVARPGGGTSYLLPENPFLGKPNNSPILLYYAGDARKSKCIKGTSISPSESEFHQQINNSFNESLTIKDFVVKIHEKYNVDIFHDQTPIQPAPISERRFLVDGTTTDNQAGLQKFQHKLVGPHQFIQYCEQDITTHEQIARDTAIQLKL